MFRQGIPQISCIFVSRFDVIQGNHLLWSRITEPINIQGLEFKSIPSGLQSNNRDVIYFTQTDETFGLMPGIAVYRQLYETDEQGTFNRATARMLSLGVVCRPEKDSLATKVWVFIKDLERLMDRLIASNHVGTPSFDHISTYMESNMLSYDMSYRHPISRCVDFIRHYKELIFPIWKSAMLQKRILLVNSCGMDCETFCDFTYILHLLSTVTKDISTSLRRLDTNSNLLYSVGLSDLEWLKSNNPEAQRYIATTTDAIIIDKIDAYDVAVVSTPTGVSIVPSRTRLPTSLTMTYSARDARRFFLLIESLEVNIEEEAPRNYTTYISNLSRNLSNFITSNFYGFLWWASAGEQSNIEDQADSDGLPLLNEVDDLGNFDTESEPWEIIFVGYFHQMIRRLFHTCSFLVQNHQVQSNEGEGIITIEPPDLLEMGLDPLSSQDREFAVLFIQLQFGHLAVVNHFFPNLYCC